MKRIKLKHSMRYMSNAALLDTTPCNAMKTAVMKHKMMYMAITGTVSTKVSATMITKATIDADKKAEVKHFEGQF